MILAEALGEHEKLAREQARRDGQHDRVAFARSLGISPQSAEQEAILRHAGKRLLVKACRQFGKSTLAALRAIHHAYYLPKALVLILAPSERQSGETFRKVLDLLRAFPVAPQLVEENRHSLELENGSRIVALPCSENTIRGYSSVTLLILDEAGDISRELFGAVFPMLARSKGSIVVQGTPKGRRGLFFDLWENAEPDAWDRVDADYTRCPWITPAEIREARRLLGDLFEQEYGCRFLILGTGLVYGSLDAARNVVDALPPPAVPGRVDAWEYLLGIDFGVINGTAFTVGAWRAADPILYVLRSYKRRGMSPSEATDEVRELEKRYAFSRISADCGGLGKAFQVELLRRGLPVDAALKTNKRGYLSILNGDLKSGRVVIVRDGCTELLDEIAQLRWVDPDAGEPREDPGADNDCADSFLYCWRSATAYLEEARAAEPPRTMDQVIRERTDAYWSRKMREHQGELDDRRMLTLGSEDWWGAQSRSDGLS